jgi:hypothetical protein
MLKKIDLINQEIKKMTLDQDAQKQLSLEMVGKLSKYKKLYDLQLKFNKSGKEAEKMAEIAINFEEYLKPFIGSFQWLINKVCQQDSSLNNTVSEVQSLVEDIMTSKTGSFMSAKADDISRNMLDFLVINEQKKDRLMMAVEEAQRQGIDWSWQEIDINDCGDLTTAINALQSHIDEELKDYQFLYGLKTSKADFTQLDRLLSQGKWKEADQETGKVMSKIMGRETWGYSRKDDSKNFPPEELKIIDQLWVIYSNGKFGFSVQKQIWIDCGGTPGVYNRDVHSKFSNAVGWMKGGEWLYYSELTFNTNVPFNGHLPFDCGYNMRGDDTVGKVLVVDLFSRL